MNLERTSIRRKNRATEERRKETDRERVCVKGTGRRGRISSDRIIFFIVILGVVAIVASCRFNVTIFQRNNFALWKKNVNYCYTDMMCVCA